MRKGVKYGWYEHEGDAAHFYQCNFDIMLVLRKMSEQNKMLTEQIKYKDGTS